LKAKTQIFHSCFTLNGLNYEYAEDLLAFAKKLSKEGDDFEIRIGNFIQKWLNDDDFIIVKTSGSTGDAKKIKLKKQHLINSARATGAYFDLGENTSALLCLSAKYIGGKMMLIRAMTLGWDLHIVSPEKDALTQYDNDYDFVAMVPYQVYHSLGALKKVKKLIIGGGSVSRELIEDIKDISTEVFATYGMTETCSHVAVKALNGKNKSEVFSALSNVTFTTDERNCLVIDAPHIADDIVTTNDLVELISPTAFKWLGRYDNVINSGGIKIHPEKLEEKLASFIKLPFIIASEKDDQLGERVILILENEEKNKVPNYSVGFASLEGYEKPKKIYTITQFPFTDTGKIKRADVLQLLREFKK
jgi:O-succinylbenzoic acid--CoA ligase